MKRPFLFWANVGLLLVYLGISPFQDLNGRLFHLPLTVSRTITYGLVLSGISLSVVNLKVNLNRWVIPTICLVIYLLFFLL